MVGPTRREATQDNDYRLLGVAVVVLIALSGGLIALQGDASPVVAAASVLGGALVGLALVLYLNWSLRG